LKIIIIIIQKINLSKIEVSYLHLFVRYPHYTAYALEHDKKILDEKGAYKLNNNAYRRTKIILRKLHKLKLIKLDKEKEKNPKKKFYSLTDIGIFYLIRLPTFLSIDIQSMIKNYPKFKLFRDLLYPFINLGTLCSENFPENIHIRNTLSLHIQQLYFKIENFVSYTINKKDWSIEYHVIWDEEKLRKYLIDKYKYKWLENADSEVNEDRMSIIYFNNNNKLIDFIEIRLRGNKTSGYLINGTKKKKKEEIIPNMKNFLIKLYHFSKEELIGRSFSNYYTIRDSEFIFSLLSASTSYTFDTSLLFSKDENFIQALETAKKDFVNFYLSIKNPYQYLYQYSVGAEIMKDLWELSSQRDKDDK